MTPPRLVTVDEIRDAAVRIRGVARTTPLIDATLPGGPALGLKCENLQPVGAFKIRGAYNMTARLSEAERARGVVTYSSGNHGQAVAYAARLLGVPAVIVMPTTAPAIKVEGARGWGAEVVFEGTTSTDRRARAEAEARARGLTMVPPFDHPWIIAGQGTVGLEIAEQQPDVAQVYIPVGGGGLLAGTAAVLKALRPAVRVVGVEPVGAAKMRASLAAGGPVTLEKTASIADGLLPVRPGDLTFAHAQAFVDEMVTVEEAAIARTVAWLYRRARLVVEPSGAAAVAAVLDRRPAAGESGPAVAVVSGGNLAPDRLMECLSLPG